jgi:hypothetical protein
MRGVLLHASAAAFAVAAALVTSRDARACGGCFHPPTQVTQVTGHRMAFSISPQQSVLWDQIQYSGSPQDFAWVLPVMAGAQVQLSHDEFFAALDALTDPVITGPNPNCSPGGGVGCGASASNAAGGGFAESGNDGVQVVSQSVVGPYDTVTVHSSDPNALYDWLNVNQYVIPDSMRPVIDAYVAAGFDFLALRLAPGQGVQAMQPVRVVSPGAGVTLPLRMVAAGAGAQVGITLYVLSDGRYEAQNFPDAVVDGSKLVWLHAQNTSNYETLAEGLMQQGGGRTWLTEYAEGTTVASTTTTCGVAAPGYGGPGYAANDLASYYFSQCTCGGGAGSPVPFADAGADGGAQSVPSTDCSTFDDLAVATTGLDSSSTWVTRLRSILPGSALADGDLVLQASSSQTAVSNQYTALVYDDPSYDACGGNGSASNGSGGGGCSTVREDTVGWGHWFTGGALAFAGYAFLRRRRGARR